MASLARLIARASSALNQAGSLVVLPLLTVLVTADVILRYVFNSPLNWGLDASRHLLVLFFLFGLVESFRTGAHVRMELLAHRMPAGLKRAASLIYGLLTLVVFGMVIKKVAEEIPFLYALPEVSETLHLRIWIFYAIIVAVVALLLAYVAVACIAVLQGRRTDLEEVTPKHMGEEA